MIGRPSVLVPLPHSLDNDQKANAEKLAEAGAAVMIEQKDFTEEALAARLAQLFATPAALEAAAKAAREKGQPGAVRALADLVEALGRGEYRALRNPAARDAPNEDGPTMLKFVAGGL